MKRQLAEEQIQKANSQHQLTKDTQLGMRGIRSPLPNGQGLKITLVTLAKLQ